MSYRMENELFFEAFQFAETVLSDKQRLLEEFQGDQFNRSDLCEARDALQGLIQQTESLLQFSRSLLSDDGERAALVKIEHLQEDLREARRQTNRSNRKVKRLKQKLTRMEDKYDRLLDKIFEEERFDEGDCVDLASHLTYPEIELLSSDEWGEVEDMPPDSPHLWKYEGIE
ncbi:hypothetical protein FGB62_25g428 [Gracilaria domingensis]|nr:hypothetical protein FGB62_25g428 [Gracilaria domingensis]